MYSHLIFATALYTVGAIISPTLLQRKSDLPQGKKLLKYRALDSIPIKSHNLNHWAILPGGLVRMWTSKRCVNMLESLGVCVSFSCGVHWARD